MDQIWNDLFTGGIPLVEKVLRTVLVYLAIVVLLRIVGKRNLAQFNTFDLVVILLLSNVVQNAVIGPDNSLIGGLIGAVVLISINGAVVRATASNERLARIVEGTPTEIATDGHYDLDALHHLGLREIEVEESLRRQGVSSVSAVKSASLEPNGSITLELKDSEQPATRGDIDKLAAQLASIQARLP